jgi:DNA polymerase-1
MELQKDLFESTLVKDKISHAKKTKNIAWLETANLILVKTEEQLRQLVTEALATDVPKAVDTETTGVTKDDKIVGVSVSWKKHDTGEPIAFYVPICSEIEEIEIPSYTTLSILKPLIEQPCVWYNFKFDYQVLKSVGIEAGLLADVSLMELFLKEGLDNAEFNRLKNSGLKQRFKEIFDLDMLALSDVLGKGVYNFSLAPLELAKSYATVDAYATLKLYYHYLTLINEKDFIYGLETKVMPIVANMEYQGIKIDLDYVREAREELMAENRALSEKVFELAGEKFNIGSPILLTHILFEKLKLPVLKFIEDKNGNISTKPSTDKEALSLLKGKHEIIEPLLKYKENLKLINTFLDKIVNVASDGNLHTSYRPYGAISGRFTSSNPSLQQIPKSSDDDSNKALIRKCFVSRPGYYMVEADYMQMEYSLYASLSKDPELIAAFQREGVDFHKSTASLMFGIPIDEVTKADRQRAKTLNFGVLFGMSTKSLSENLNCTEEEAEKLHETYFSKMPVAKSWVSTLHSQIAQNKESETFWGRRRLLPKARSTSYGEKQTALREGLNHRIQGTGADCTKVAMVRLSNQIKGKDMHILLQVHDSLLLEVPESIPVGDVVVLLRKSMELKIPEFAPLRVDIQFGYNWGQLTTYKEGMTLENVEKKVRAEKPKSIIIEGDLITKGEALKSIFKKYPGEIKVMLKVGESFLQPTDVDEETGEILEVTVKNLPGFIEEVSKLGLNLIVEREDLICLK